MKSLKQHKIYTIGHSTHPIEVFLSMLNGFGIQKLVDIRRLPGSRKYPQFDKDNLEISLQQAGIEYFHLTELGGRRKAKKDSKNIRWNNVSFRGYADYMETEEFENGILQLEQIAEEKVTVYMCSEAVWWRCHHSMVSDYLKAKGWDVLHIMTKTKAQEHKYTAPAFIINDKVSYSAEINS